jgi:hypothetical protein
MFMQKENNITTSRPRRFTVTGEYDNADLITQGDVCIVRPGAPYQRGEMVLVECLDNCHEGHAESHYHAKYYFPLNGKKYTFRLSRRECYGSGTRHKAGEEKIIIGPVLKVVRKGQREEKAKSTSALKSYQVLFSWSLYGIHHGDSVTVNENGQAKPGQLILVTPKDGNYEDSFFTRCCLVTSDTVRVEGGDDGPYDKPASSIIGAVVQISHDNCNHTKAEALRERLRNLGDDITDSTEAFKIEREIYDLEHPIEEEAEADTGSDEWPEVIEDEN